MFNRLFALPDRWLSRVGMYRLVIYYLIFLLELAVVESWLGYLDYSVAAIAGTAAVAVGVCGLVNLVFARTFGAPVNSDSAIITGLIIALIAGPVATRSDAVFIAWAATLAMASKYILAWRRVHLFNPAAIALVITAAFANQTASWWVGTVYLTPAVIVGGVLLARKIRRGELVTNALWASFFVTFAWSAHNGNSFTQALHRGVADSPVWFLVFVMLTEPVTLPPARGWQTAYALLAGVLLVPQLHLGHYYLTPELALVLANAAAIPVRSRQKRVLWLDRALTLGPGLADFLYVPATPLPYRPGQYMEWTLDHDRVDARGKRRYFTLASSPTERTLRVGVKFVEAGSSFKQAMIEHGRARSAIVATQVSGDFTLPRDQTEKLAFIAGGIGVTPFRSMVKYLTDRRERRDIVLLYANRHYNEILYRNVFEAARKVLRFRGVYVLSDPASAPPFWEGESGRIDSTMIARQIPDFRERRFYVSGSPSLVQGVQAALRDLGVKADRIKTDYFTGLAS